MNNRQFSRSQNEWNREKTNIPFAGRPQIASTSYSMRPRHGIPRVFNNSNLNTPESYLPKTTRFTTQCNPPLAVSTSGTAINIPTNQNAIYPPRLNDTTPVPSPCEIISPSFDVINNKIPLQMKPSSSATKEFSRIPCNVSASPQTCGNISSSNFNAPVPAPNLNVAHGFAQKPFGHVTRFLPSGPPPLNAFQNIFQSSNNNLASIQIKNMPNSIQQSDQHMHTVDRLSVQKRSNITDCNQPPLTGEPNFARLPFPSPNYNLPPTQTINRPNSNQQIVPDLNMTSVIQQSLTRSNIDPNKQVNQFEPNLSDFSRPPPSLGFSLPDLTKQPPAINSISAGFSSEFRPNALNLMSGSSNNFPLTLSMQPAGEVSQNLSDNVYGNNVVPPLPVKLSYEELKLNKFLERFSSLGKQTTEKNLTVAEFRSRSNKALSILKKLMICKEKLLDLLEADQNIWNIEFEKSMDYKAQLIKECEFLAAPENLKLIQEKLKNIKKKKELKKKLKRNKLKAKTKKIAEREELNQEIDKWLDSIEEKNLKLKRETELKKEADSILAEVRRKIHEAKRTIEKIRMFEKLRSARHANASQKGLFLPNHDKRFQFRITELKNIMLKQLSDYESEEKALKVMLEAEQEGQLEEEALWRVKKLKNIQQRRQKNILECLFGKTDEISDQDPIFLFHQYQDSGNKSIENLVQIRYHWDLHLNENGDRIPSQWVVPVAPSSNAWEVALQD